MLQEILVSECVDEIAAWMRANRPELHGGKNAVIWFSSRQNLKNIQSNSVHVCVCVLESNIIPSKTWESILIETSRCQRRY